MQTDQNLKQLKDLRYEINKLQDVLFNLSEVLLDEQQDIIDEKYKKCVEFFKLKF